MSDQGALTDEAIAALRRRIGVATPHPQPPWYREPGTDAFRHVAEAFGDDNPLWCDPDYGAGTVWGEPIASPNMNGGDTLIGENEITQLDPDTKALLKGDPLKGAHAYYAGSHREWWRPVRAGHADHPPQRPRRRARQGQRVRRAVGARVDGRGLRCRRPRAVGPVSADDPHRPGQGGVHERLGQVPGRRDPSLHRRASWPASTTSTRPSPLGGGAANPATGRTSTKARRSARW